MPLGTLAAITAATAASGAGLMAAGDQGGTSIEQRSSLTPVQEGLMSKLGPFIKGRLGEPTSVFGPTEYPEEGEFYWTAPPSEQERRAQELASQYGGTAADLGVLEEATRAGLRGMSPERIEEIYREKTLPLQRRILEEEILPRVRESAVGPGLQWSSSRQRAEQRAIERWGEQRSAELGGLIQKEREAARRFVPTAQQALNFIEQEPLRRAATLQQFGALQRQLRQREISRRAEAFRQSQPEMSPAVDRALQILGVPATVTYAKREQPSTGYQIGSMLLSGATKAGSYAGGKAMASRLG